MCRVLTGRFLVNFTRGCAGRFYSAGASLRYVPIPILCEVPNAKHYDKKDPRNTQNIHPNRKLNSPKIRRNITFTQIKIFKD